MPRKPKESINFESALEELTGLIEQLETGKLPLEESLKHFERGISLTRDCQTALKTAEQKLQLLTKESDEWVLQPYDEENS